MAYVSKFVQALKTGDLAHACNIAARKRKLSDNLGPTGIADIPAQLVAGLAACQAADADAGNIPRDVEAVVVSLLDVLPVLSRAHFLDDTVATAAARAGVIDYLEWHHAAAAEAKHAVRIPTLLRAAIAAGETAAADRIIALYELDDIAAIKILCPPAKLATAPTHDKRMQAGAWGLAARDGHVASFQWIDRIPNGSALIIPLLYRLVYRAVHGTVSPMPMLRCLHERFIWRLCPPAQLAVYARAEVYPGSLVETLMMLPTWSEWRECVEWLIEHSGYDADTARAPKDTRKKKDSTILIRAAAAGRADILTVLVDLGLTADDVMDHGGEAVYQALNLGHTGVMDVFLRSAAQGGFVVSVDVLRTALRPDYVLPAGMSRYVG